MLLGNEVGRSMGLPIDYRAVRRPRLTVKSGVGSPRQRRHFVAPDAYCRFQAAMEYSVAAFVVVSGLALKDVT